MGASSAVASSSRSPSTPGRGPAVSRAAGGGAFLDYVDGGRQVALDPGRVTGQEFRALLARLLDAIAQGVFVQEPSSCDFCDFTVVCGPKALLERRRQYKIKDRLVQRVLRLKDITVSFTPVDQEARERARRDHAVSFVLEAGAGTGKTTLLIDRIERLILSGHASLEEIAAVTFTENAATTLKLRLRERLERARAGDGVPAQERERAAGALDLIERAQVSTIHALCGAILQERPLECGVPPGFRVADEAETDRLFAEAWSEWLDSHLVQGDPVLAEALDRNIPLEGIFGYGERTSLRGFARLLLEQRDLEPLLASAAPDAGAWRSELLVQAGRGRELAAQAKDGDALAVRLEALASFADQSRFLTGEVLLSHLRRLPIITKSFGHKPRWPSAEVLTEARKVAIWTKQAAESWNLALSAQFHGRLVEALQDVIRIYERKKRAQGMLDFLDLLIKTRDALKRQPSLRSYFHSRFRFLIIDEFQDTDPLQVEIAGLLAGEHPGSLVMVGDAKQSIYRFRRAEVSLFREAAEEARSRPGRAVLHLTQNFRSRPAILRFVNRVFSQLIQPSVEAGQPEYQAITPPPDLPNGPAVIALRFSAPSYAQGGDLLSAEAAALTAVIAQAAAGHYPVRDPGSGVLRPSRAGDVMVLTRRLSQVRHLEEALERAGLRFVVEGGKSFFDRQEVHEVLAVLRALDDPSDRVSLVAALRSSFFGVNDRDIVSYALAGGLLWLGKADPSKPGGQVLAAALGLLDELHRQRTGVSVPLLLERLYQGARILPALTGTRRGEARIANLEKVVALGRQASDMGVLTLRGFVRLLEERVAEAREEPDLPSTRPGDPETVRVLTIHKAKGLEAPMVALFDSADDLWVHVDVVPLWREGKIAIGFREGCQPPQWDVLRSKEEGRIRAEARRLLYVACTRARDLLIVPSPPKDARVGDFWKDLIEQLPATSDADVQVLDADTLPAPQAEGLTTDLRAVAVAEGGDAVAARWEAERAERIERGGLRPLTPISVTRAAARTAPPAVWAAGSRGGRDFGSLVHKLLEWIPLEAGEPEGVASAARALAPAYGVDEEGARRAAEAVLGVLGLSLLDRARRASRVWRELPVWFPEGNDLAEGSVDLVFEEEGALVVVDYKTDSLTPGQALAQAAHHAPQLQLYGRGLAQATGLRVKERLVLFTALGQAVPV